MEKFFEDLLGAIINGHRKPYVYSMYQKKPMKTAINKATRHCVTIVYQSINN